MIMYEVGRLGQVSLDIAMVVVGALNDEECDDDKNATYFLKVSAWLTYKFL